MLESKKIRKLSTLALILYMFCLVWVITLKCNMVIPVVESRYFFSKMSLLERFSISVSKFANTTARDFLANCFLFIHVGVLIPFLKKKNPIISTALLGFAISLGFEVLQIIICIGGFTYIDIISNSLGALLGSIIHHFLRKKVTDKQTETALIVSIIICVIVISFGLFNTLKHIDIYITKDFGKYI